MRLPKDKLNDWLVALKKYSLFAPTESNDVTRFTSIDDPSEIVLEHNSLRPPKEIFFPQTETMFTFMTGEKKGVIPPTPNGDKRVIFGIRPCDARSFTILDHVFSDDYKDEYYLEKRENTVLIGLACTPLDININCFCTSVDGGPGSADDVDILLTDMGEQYYVDAVTPKGKALMSENSSLFTPITDADAIKKQEIITKAEEKIKRGFDANGIDKILVTMFDSDFWKEISMKCLGCGTCTYLCPTCHCFDIQDETTGNQGKRVRIWDTCMNPEYTMHASGFNPRPGRMNRMRNRVYHKYKYYPANYGVIACIGCGRCVDNCSVNVDIIDTISRIKEGVND